MSTLLDSLMRVGASDDLGTDALGVARGPVARGVAGMPFNVSVGHDLDRERRLWFFVQTWNGRMLFTAKACGLEWA